MTDTGGSGQWVGVLRGGALLLTLASACTQSDRLAAPEQSSPPRAAVQLPPPGPFGAPFFVAAPQFNTDAIAPEKTGMFVPPGAVALIVVTGTVTYTVNPATAGVCPPGVPISPPGGFFTVGPAGFLGANDPRYQGGGFIGGNVVVVEGSEDSPQGGVQVQLAPLRPSATTLTGTVQGFSGLGRIWVYRPASFPGACGVPTPPGGPAVNAYLATGGDVVSAELAAGNCRLPVEPESQSNPDWGPLPYDTSLETIGELGCALTSLSMALQYAGIPRDPYSLNVFMERSSGDFVGHNVNWDATVRDASDGLGLKWQQFESFDGQLLASSVCEQRTPIVVGVKLDASGNPHHFVLATGVQDGNVLIADPGDPTNTVLTGPFVSKGFVHDPAGSIGGLDLGVSNQRLLLTDASGRRTGFDPLSRAKLQDIPQSSYSEDGLEDLPTFAALATVFQPADGAYRVTVVGANLGTYELSLRAFGADGTAQTPMRLPGLTDGTTSTSFEVQYSAAPGAAPVAKRLATFAGTLADIAIALRLGLIDNQGIATALSQKTEAAERAAARGDTPASANILGAFMALVRASRGKHIDAFAAEVLLDDAAGLRDSL